MANHFCNSCGSDVEDVGGFCLLGHRLAAAAPPPPPPPLETVTLAVETAQPEPSLIAYESSLDATWAALGTAPGAPPVPDDPINSFAPPARMDWGPREGVRRFSLKRLRAEVSV